MTFGRNIARLPAFFRGLERVGDFAGRVSMLKPLALMPLSAEPERRLSTRDVNPAHRGGNVSSPYPQILFCGRTRISVTADERTFNEEAKATISRASCKKSVMPMQCSLWAKTLVRYFRPIGQRGGSEPFAATPFNAICDELKLS